MDVIISMIFMFLGIAIGYILTDIYNTYYKTCRCNELYLMIKKDRFNPHLISLYEKGYTQMTVTLEADMPDNVKIFKPKGG